jgi:G:T-mismatch repair DNA endonuclease (very short patch repair protein)
LAPRSKAEIYLEFELRQFFDIDSDGSVIRIGEKNLRCDIVLKSHKIVIEFDGSYWHKELQTRDEEKTRLLTKAGWQVIRVREEPLGATSSLDVIVPQQSIKKTADAVIRHLLQLGVQPLVSPNKYLKMGKSTNEDQANQYITQRLKKRAVRRARESQSRNR